MFKVIDSVLEPVSYEQVPFEENDLPSDVEIKAEEASVLRDQLKIPAYVK